MEENTNVITLKSAKTATNPKNTGNYVCFVVSGFLLMIAVNFAIEMAKRDTSLLDAGFMAFLSIATGLVTGSYFLLNRGLIGLNNNKTKMTHEQARSNDRIKIDPDKKRLQFDYYDSETGGMRQRIVGFESVTAIETIALPGDPNGQLSIEFFVNGDEGKLIEKIQLAYCENLPDNVERLLSLMRQ